MIVLYSNHCPACNVLKAKLDSKNIEYTIVDDEETLTANGFDFMPVLEVDGKRMQIGEANKFVASYEET